MTGADVLATVVQTGSFSGDIDQDDLEEIIRIAECAIILVANLTGASKDTVIGALTGAARQRPTLRLVSPMGDIA